MTKDPECTCEFDLKWDATDYPTMTTRTPDPECQMHKKFAELVVQVRLDEASALLRRTATRLMNKHMARRAIERSQELKAKLAKAEQRAASKTSLTHRPFEALLSRKEQG